MYLDNEHAKVIKRGRKTTWSEVDLMDTKDAQTGYYGSTQILKYPQDSWPRKVNEEMRSKAQTLLTSMVEMIDIQVVVDSTPGNAGTACPNQGPLPADVFVTFPRGSRTLINMNRSLIEDLVMEKRPLYESLDLAEMMLHEFAHALQHATHGPRQEECFYKNARYSEAGYDFTSEIFGGVFQTVNVESLWCQHDPTGRQTHFDKYYDDDEILEDGDN